MENSHKLLFLAKLPLNSIKIGRNVKKQDKTEGNSAKRKKGLIVLIYKNPCANQSLVLDMECSIKRTSLYRH